MIYPTDKNQITSLIDYSIIKSRRFVRSLLGGETFGMADECDAYIVLNHDIQKITGKDRKIEILTYSETLLKVMIRNASTSKRRIMIDIKSAREHTTIGPISGLIWIQRDENIADAITESKKTTPVY